MTEKNKNSPTTCEKPQDLRGEGLFRTRLKEAAPLGQEEVPGLRGALPARVSQV